MGRHKQNILLHEVLLTNQFFMLNQKSFLMATFRGQMCFKRFRLCIKLPSISSKTFVYVSIQAQNIFVFRLGLKVRIIAQNDSIFAVVKFRKTYTHSLNKPNCGIQKQSISISYAFQSQLMFWNGFFKGAMFKENNDKEVLSKHLKLIAKYIM